MVFPFNSSYLEHVLINTYHDETTTILCNFTL